MKGGVLEVLVVSAEGLKHARHLRSSSEYVILECGSQTRTSKITPGKDRKAWWNEKFIFKLGNSEWKSVDQIKLRIMEKDKFVDDCTIGEATIYLRSILREGSQKGSIELKPAPYNIVLKDGTYEGELKVGLKFYTKVDVEEEICEKEYSLVEKQPQTIYKTILNFTLRKIPWQKFLFFKTCANLGKRKKDK